MANNARFMVAALAALLIVLGVATRVGVAAEPRVRALNRMPVNPGESKGYAEYEWWQFCIDESQSSWWVWGALCYQQSTAPPPTLQYVVIDSYDVNSSTLPAGFQLGEMVVGNQTFPATIPVCGASEDIKFRLNKQPPLSEGDFEIDFNVETRSFWDDGGVWPETDNVVVTGSLSLHEPRIVVRETHLSGADDETDRVCWVHPDAGVVGAIPGCDSVETFDTSTTYSSGPDFHIVKYDDPTMWQPVEKRIEVFSANSRPVYVDSVGLSRVARVKRIVPGPKIATPFCIDSVHLGSFGAAPGGCAQLVDIFESPELPNMALPAFDPAIGFTGGSPLTIDLTFGTQGADAYAVGEHSGLLDLNFHDCWVNRHRLTTDGHVLDQPAEVEVRIVDPFDRLLANDGNFSFNNRIDIPLDADIPFTVRLTNIDADRDFDGHLKVANLDSSLPLGFGVVGAGSQIPVSLDPGESVDVDFRLRTDSEYGKKFRADLKLVPDFGPMTFNSRIKATVDGSPLLVQGSNDVIPLQGIERDGEYLGERLEFFANPSAYETITVENTSGYTVDLVAPTRSLVSGNASVVLHAGAFSSTLGPYESTTFGIEANMDPSDSCLFPAHQESIAFDWKYAGETGWQQFQFRATWPMCTTTFLPFNWVGCAVGGNGACGFFMGQTPTGGAVTSKSIELMLPLDYGIASLQLDVAVYGDGAFSTNRQSIALNAGETKTIRVDFQPPTFGTYAAEVVLTDTALDVTWEFPVEGETCGLLDGSACTGGGCQDGLQECDGSVCRYCCTDGSSNDVCGTRPGGSCSDVPGSQWYDFDCVQCTGTDHKWRSDFDNQPPWAAPDQPDPPVCLQDDQCLYSTGGAAPLGRVKDRTWICGTASIDSRAQGVWYQCDSTRLNAGIGLHGHTCQHLDGSRAWVGSCPGTAFKWRSDSLNQSPYQASDQPDPANCLTTSRCLHGNGSSAPGGSVDDTVWMCDSHALQGRAQGAWFQCEATRAAAVETRRGHQCMRYNTTQYAWIDDCPGTEHKWQSSTNGQAPYQSPEQPSPQTCLSSSRCLYSTGGSAARGHVTDESWICGVETIGGDSQGVWYQCEATRAAAGVQIENHDCVNSGGSYRWLDSSSW